MRTRLDNIAAAHRFSGLLRRRFEQLLAEEDWVAEAGIAPPTYGVLSVIGAFGPISQKEVCDLLGRHPSDMVALMDRLEHLGWVQRTRDPQDRRRYAVTLTEDGRGVLAAFDELSRRAEAEVLAPLSADEQSTLHDLIGKVLEVQGIFRPTHPAPSP